MNTRVRKFLSFLAYLLAFVVMLAIAGWYWHSHVFIEAKVYPKNSTQLDLRGEDISLSHWQTLRSRLPECEILWDVPFQGQSVSSDIRQLRLTGLAEADIPLLDCFPQLERLDASGCGEYDLLAELAARRPELEVVYSIPINGHDWAPDTTRLVLTDISDGELDLLAWLPALRQVDATGISDLSRVAALKNALPECEITYQVTLFGETYPQTTESLTLEGADPAVLAEMLPWLPQLKTLTLHDPVPDAAALLALPEQFPQVEISWTSQVYGLTMAQDTRELDLTGIPLDTTESLRQVLACYPGLERLVVSRCGLDNETLAAFREAVRQEYKVVWSVQMGPLTVLTDATYFIPVKYNAPYMSDADVADLRYCEDMVAIDLGHHHITHCDWAAYMPKLKYLIIADSSVADISGLEGRTELVFLELFLTPVKDLTPLESCTALEDLNLSYAWFADPTPVTRMTWVKRLWWAQCPWGESKFREYLPETEFFFYPLSSTGGTWREGKNYYDMRDLMGMFYMGG